MAQPLKKKEPKRFSVKDLKASTGIAVESSADIKKSVAEKPIEWIIMPEAYQEALKLPGIPMGYVTVCRGWSDTGKSTIKNCLVSAAMKQGILPVIFETESNFDFSYAKDCGMQVEPVYGDVEEYDEETGEEIVVNKIIDWEGEYMLLTNNTILEYTAKNGGKAGTMDYKAGVQSKKMRNVAVIEDVAYIISDLLERQADGDIPMPLLFVWDSVGTLPSYANFISKTGSNMFDAGAMESAFKTIWNIQIPSSKQVGYPYTNTFFAINKVWQDVMNSMGGAVSIENKGGKALYWATRLGIHLGGTAKAATKKLKATLKGEEYQYGIISKISVYKNHLPSPYNITYNGTMCCVHNGIIPESELDSYKKKAVPVILEKMKAVLGEQALNGASEKDMEFTEVEEYEM